MARNKIIEEFTLLLLVLSIFLITGCRNWNLINETSYGPLQEREQLIGQGPIQERVRTEKDRRVLETRTSRLVKKRYANAIARKGVGGVLLNPMGLLDLLLLVSTHPRENEDVFVVYDEWRVNRYVEDKGVTSTKNIIKANPTHDIVKNNQIQRYKTVLAKDTQVMRKWLLSGKLLTKKQFDRIVDSLSVEEILAQSPQIFQVIPGPTPNGQNRILFFENGKDSRCLALLTVQLAYKYKTPVEKVKLEEYDRVLKYLPALMLRNKYIANGFEDYESYQEQMKKNMENFPK